ncbi:MAG: DUF1292 domain-containing protein [Firmicutes bacterium]|nr:DUF1292 domain-containing protein [Bacillota bacterium]MCL1954214.1 DUF1292 domain-containing protein [Bacillota bacterium]
MNNDNNTQIQPKVQFLEDNYIFALSGDDGEDEVDFYGIALIELDGQSFMLAQPVEDDQGIEEDEAVIFKLQEQDKDTMLYLSLTESEEELVDRVFEEYLRATADME